MVPKNDTKDETALLLAEGTLRRNAAVVLDLVGKQHKRLLKATHNGKLSQVQVPISHAIILL